jgi:hypothetical protein
VKRIAAIVFALFTACTPIEVSPAVEAGWGEQPLTQSREPFILNPRFCAGIGNACAVQPQPC